MLTSLVVPVLVRAEKEDPDHGEAFIRRLFTLSVSLLGAVTILSVILAPNLVKMALSSESKVNLAISTSFAYWLLPQIFFYGVFALLMAVLNTKNVFKPGAWAPVINNIITPDRLGALLGLAWGARPQRPQRGHFQPARAAAGYRHHHRRDRTGAHHAALH